MNRQIYVWYMAALLIVAGCASTEVYNRKQLVTGPLPRPATVWVYDFGATSADVQKDSGFSGLFSQENTTQTAEDITQGRMLGARIATGLIREIRDMGMPGKKAVDGSALQINDIVIRGYIISYDEGSAAKRVTIGFGSGASNLKVAVEGFQVTAEGLRKLGSGASSAGGNATPGSAVGAAAWIATANPAGFVVSTGVKAYGEASGRSKVEGRADQTAKEIAKVLEKRFKELGWI